MAVSFVVLGAVACAPIRETRTDRVLSTRLVRTEQRWLPMLDEVSASVSVQSGAAHVVATRAQTCLARSEQQMLVLRRIRSEPASSVLVLEGLAVGMGVAFVGLAGLDDSNDQGGEFSALGVLGAGVIVGGGLALAIDTSKYDTDESRVIVRGPVEERTAPCFGTRLPQRIALFLPDGTALSGLLDTEGQATVPIPEAVWASHPGRLDADLWIDGQPVRRVILKREPRR